MSRCLRIERAPSGFFLLLGPVLNERLEPLQQPLGIVQPVDPDDQVAVAHGFLEPDGLPRGRRLLGQGDSRKEVWEKAGYELNDVFDLFAEPFSKSSSRIRS